ncbi:hypothetical protein A0H81_10472 [Grifola frondosa]|uniref:Uncharacterized protein n=1 Tax=Grifola frondosa TaxID=5627 RepID=A0A1C7M0M8_GRIFR|nr:hypothetical protein A0H81_10472 [Grifola frondosa]
MEATSREQMSAIAVGTSNKESDIGSIEVRSIPVIDVARPKELAKRANTKRIELAMLNGNGCRRRHDAPRAELCMKVSSSSPRAMRKGGKEWESGREKEETPTCKQGCLFGKAVRADRIQIGKLTYPTL